MTRSGVASELIASPDDDLDHNCIKIKALFCSELQECATEGTCGLRLFVLILLLRIIMKADTQDIEGLNSLIRLICMRCRGIGLPLLCARVRTKKRLKIGFQGCSTRWSNIRPHAIALFNDSISHYERALDIMNDATRYSVPQLPSACAPAAGHVSTARESSRQAKWSAAYALLANKKLKELIKSKPLDPGFEYFIYIGSPGELQIDSLVYMVSDRVYSMMWLSEFRAYDVGVDDELALCYMARPVMPCSFVGFLRFELAWHARCNVVVLFVSLCSRCVSCGTLFNSAYDFVIVD